MFLQEIATDVIVEVNGRRMRGEFDGCGGETRRRIGHFKMSIFRFSSQVHSGQSMPIFCRNFSRWLGECFRFRCRITQRSTDSSLLQVQSAGDIISLPGYSYGSVHFALCHIYSGASHPPEGISLMELAALADLLGLEGLKEVTAHALRTNYCHNFHKPCSGKAPRIRVGRNRLFTNLPATNSAIKSARSFVLLLRTTKTND